MFVDGEEALLAVQLGATARPGKMDELNASVILAGVLLLFSMIVWAIVASLWPRLIRHKRRSKSKGRKGSKQTAASSNRSIRSSP